MYVSQHEMEIVCVRIGNFSLDRDQPEHPHHLSHGDAVLVKGSRIVGLEALAGHLLEG
jgi:UDP-N-acetylmuramyl pentapeptide synthase